MIDMKIRWGLSDAVAAKFQEWSVNRVYGAMQVLQTRLRGAMQQLAAYIVLEKLSGQVLHRRSEKLARSVRVIDPKIRGRQIVMGIEAATGDAFYGKYHETGINHEWVINAKGRALRFVSEGKVFYRQSVSVPQLPARPFMRPSLNENRRKLWQEVDAALKEALRS
jgi:hypothetical protein